MVTLLMTVILATHSSIDDSCESLADAWQHSNPSRDCLVVDPKQHGIYLTKSGHPDLKTRMGLPARMKWQAFHFNPGGVAPLKFPVRLRQPNSRNNDYYEDVYIVGHNDNEVWIFTIDALSIGIGRYSRITVSFEYTAFNGDYSKEAPRTPDTPTQKFIFQSILLGEESANLNRVRSLRSDAIEFKARSLKGK